MSNKKKSMYGVLQVSPTASYSEIKAAHKRLSLALMSNSSGLSREDINFQLNVLDVALHTLSVPALRDAYDAELVSPTAIATVVAPITANSFALGDEAKSLRVAAAIEDSQKMAAVAMAANQFPVKVITSTATISARSLKHILRAVIGMLVLGFVLKMGQMGMSHAGGSSDDIAKAEEKLIIQEYYEKYGVRPASRAEAELLEQENRRKENAQREAEFAEKRKEDEYRRFVEESRSMGERVTADRIYAEQREQYAAMEKQREQEEEKRMQEAAAQEAERMRIENERRRFGMNASSEQ